jgi:hypothetical protein
MFCFEYRTGYTSTINMQKTCTFNSTAMRAQLRKPGACIVLSLQVKYDVDNIQYSRKSCHDEYEFRTVSFTISCCKVHFYHPKL